MPLSIIMWGQGYGSISYDFAVVDWATWAVAFGVIVLSSCIVYLWRTR